MTGITRACGHGEVWELSGNADERSRKMRDLKQTDCQECQERFIAYLRRIATAEAA